MDKHNRDYKKIIKDPNKAVSITPQYKPGKNAADKAVSKKQQVKI